MLKQDFLKEMEEILDVPSRSLTGAEVLAEFDAWDSLSMLAFSVLAVENFGHDVAGAAIRNAHTVDDLFLLAGKAKAGHV